MIVCSCNVLSEAAVQTACHARSGPRTLGQVYRCLGCNPQCGRCARTIKTILDGAAPCTRAANDLAAPPPAATALLAALVGEPAE